MRVGNYSCYSGARITVNDGAKLTQSSGYPMHESVINCFKEIFIGDGIVISERVQIRDPHSYEICRTGFEMDESIHIGNHVWIGMESMILPDVDIGDGAIITAESIVTGNIPGRCWTAGVPAKVIRNNVN